MLQFADFFGLIHLTWMKEQVLNFRKNIPTFFLVEIMRTTTLPTGCPLSFLSDCHSTWMFLVQESLIFSVLLQPVTTNSLGHWLKTSQVFGDRLLLTKRGALHIKQGYLEFVPFQGVKSCIYSSFFTTSNNASKYVYVNVRNTYNQYKYMLLKFTSETKRFLVELVCA